MKMKRKKKKKESLRDMSMHSQDRVAFDVAMATADVDEYETTRENKRFSVKDRKEEGVVNENDIEDSLAEKASE
jgi:hypothetical protein